MRKFILMLLLAVVSGNAMAEWIKVGTTADTNITFYVNLATIHKKSGVVKLWVLQDYPVKQDNYVDEGKPSLSTKVLAQFQCEEEQLRLLAAVSYLEQMGNGDIVANINVHSDWRAVLPDSTWDSIMKIACGKK